MDIMHKDLINSYAHGNLQEALLVQLYVEFFKTQYANRNPEHADADEKVLRQSLLEFQGKVQTFLRLAQNPQYEADAEHIRQQAIHLTEVFFQDVQDILLPESLPE